jgi:hypothetical protein
LADIAMQSINAGMGNTLNMPSASVAYDAANRASTNVALAQLKTSLLSSFGQTQAGMYEQQQGLKASKYNADMNALGQYAAAKERADTEKYLADVTAKLAAGPQQSSPGYPSSW